MYLVLFLHISLYFSFQCDRDDNTMVDVKLVEADAKGLHEVRIFHLSTARKIHKKTLEHIL